MNFKMDYFAPLTNNKKVNRKWYIETFNTQNGKRIDYSINPFGNEIGEDLNILVSGLSKDEAIFQCCKLSKELNIPLFDGCNDCFVRDVSDKREESLCLV